jgi:phage repressor protein C with HTH and peptisase S24 domain
MSNQKMKREQKNYSYAQRVKYVRRHAGIRLGMENLSQAKFAKLLNVHTSAISHVEAGNTRLQPELAKKIEEKTGFSQAWLLTGEGRERIDAHSEIGFNNVQLPIREFTISGFNFLIVGKVKPLLSSGSGDLVYEEDYEDVYFFRSDWLSRKGVIASMRLAEVSGDSMLPILEDGDFVLFDTSRRDPLDGKIMVVGIENHLYIKRVRVSPEGIFLVSDNKSVYDPWRINPENTKFLGVVIWRCGEV